MNTVFYLCIIAVFIGQLRETKAFTRLSLSGVTGFQIAISADCDRSIGRRTSPLVLRESAQQPDYETEETLLKVHLAVQSGATLETAKEAVSKYSQSFPFAAVLPVQPLHYLPTEDDGVEIKFLRKKTDEKSGIDGGIRFFITQTEGGDGDGDDDCDHGGLDLTAKRNSIGQTIQKMMAEKLVVLAFVSGITGEEKLNYGEAPLEYVRVTSLYHKWM